MVFIRPTILSNKEDAQKVAAQRYGYIRDMQSANNPKAEPSIDVLVREYMGATPPSLTGPVAGDEVVDGRVVEPIAATQSQSVVRPVDVPPSKGKRK